MSNSLRAPLQEADVDTRTLENRDRQRGASSVMMCYDFSWEHTFAIDGKRDQLERRDTCVCVKQPQLGATSCFGAEFHLISCGFCLSGGNEDTQ